MQLKKEHSCEGLRAKHTVFDLRRFRAPVARGDGDHSLAYFKLAGHPFPIGVLEADSFTHASVLSPQASPWADHSLGFRTGG